MTRRVLIIEDDPDIIQLLYHVASRGRMRAGAGVRRKARAAVGAKNGADLILLDLMMDDMDGWSTLEASGRRAAVCHPGDYCDSQTGGGGLRPDRGPRRDV